MNFCYVTNSLKNDAINDDSTLRIFSFFSLFFYLEIIFWFFDWNKIGLKIV